MRKIFSKYTIGDACKILNITQGGIRFYEKKGILNSNRENESKYRYYNFKEVNTLMTIREYKNLGFSLEDASSLIRESSSSTLSNKFETQITKIENDIKEQQIKLEELKKKKKQIDNIDMYLNTHHLRERKGLYRLNCQEGDKVINNPEIKKLIKQWYDKSPKVKSCPCIPLINLNHGVTVEIGFSITEEDLNCISSTDPIETSPLTLNSKYITYYPPAQCVYTILEVTENDKFIECFYKLLIPSLEYIDKNNLKIVGDILGFKIATLHNNGQKDYYEAFFPIKKI